MKESADRVYEQYRGLIKSLINSIVVNNPSVVDYQDLQQTGALALVSALESYDPSVGSFSSYIRKCIRNALLEQANSFNKVFTVDEKIRRQANAIIHLRAEGLSDEDIMTRLGIKTRATFLSLLDLLDKNTICLDDLDIPEEILIDEHNLFKILKDIGLDQEEMNFIKLTINNNSIDDILSVMNITRTNLYLIKSSIRDKILTWGKL